MSDQQRREIQRKAFLGDPQAQARLAALPEVECASSWDHLLVDQRAGDSWYKTCRRCGGRWLFGIVLTGTGATDTVVQFDTLTSGT